MFNSKRIVLILPARNEEKSLPSVLNSVPPQVDHVIVADNGSSDATAEVARQHGAFVVTEPRPGYGRACLAALNALRDQNPDIVGFADADGSDDVSRLTALIDPIVNGEADFALSCRVPEVPHALSMPQRFGNQLATALIHILWGHAFRDLGPMRAIRWTSLKSLDMRDTDYGWTVEMQIKALKSGLRVREFPMPYRMRVAGRSKVSRSLNGTIRAGTKILWVILREALRDGGIK